MTTLQAALDATGIEFRHFGWAHAPTSGNYGIWSEDGDNVLMADGIHAEKAEIGTIDLFARTDDDVDKGKVETALAGIEGFAWALNSVQYEEETGVVHYEWTYQKY